MYGYSLIGAIITNDNFNPLAFINSNGTYEIVIKINKRGPLPIKGLPAGTHGIKHIAPPTRLNRTIINIIKNSIHLLFQ